MSHHPVETRLREVVENGSLQVQQKTAAASLRTERRGLRKTETRTASIFCGVGALLGRPVGFFFRADPVSSKFLIQVLIACFEGTRPWRPKLKKTSELLLRNFQTIIAFVKHFYGESTLLTVPLIHDYWMASLSVAQGPCSAVLPTVHDCHYAFQKFPFFCVTLYLGLLWATLHICAICFPGRPCVSLHSLHQMVT